MHLINAALAACLLLATPLVHAAGNWSYTLDNVSAQTLRISAPSMMGKAYPRS